MKRAETLIDSTYGKDCPLAIRELVYFAAQNSGIDPRNYYDRLDPNPSTRRAGVIAYNQEKRSITADWQRFKAALVSCFEEGVTEVQVINAGKGAYSGRLNFNGEAWEYTTGQYFPTEYRKAAACVLESALHDLRASRPPERRKVSTLRQLAELNKKNGGCWFDKDAMSFFKTSFESGIIRGRYFITSEQGDPTWPRLFTIRSFDEEGSVETVGGFQRFKTKEEALAAVPKE